MDSLNRLDSDDMCSSPLSSLPSRSPTPPSFNTPLHPLPSPSSSRCSEDRVSAISIPDFLSISESLSPLPKSARSLPSTPKRKLTRTNSAKVSVSASKAVKSIRFPSLSDPPASPSPKNKTCADHESTPPQKKRRLTGSSGPRLRQTLRLDLTQDDYSSSLAQQQEQVDLLLKVLQKKRKVVVIAGAGISVSAGIPDFRSSSGLFKTLRSQYNLKSSGKDLFDVSVYQQKSSTTTFHHMVSEMSHQVKKASPTPFHHLIASLAQQGRLLRLYTQNVDSLDANMEPLATKIPLRAPWPKTVQLHGSLEKSVCVKCHSIFDFDPSLFSGPTPPPCQHCKDHDFTRTAIAGKRSHGVGHLRPRMVLYNELGPDDLSIGTVSAADLKSRPDALIVVGTTLKVPGTRRLAKEMAATVQSRRDGITVWINYDREPSGNGLDKCWDLVVKGPCDKVAELANLPKWDDPQPQSQAQSEQLSSSQESTCSLPDKPTGRFVLTIDVPTKSHLTSAIPTPTVSPQRRDKPNQNGELTPIPLNLTGVPNLLKVTKTSAKSKPATTKQPRKRAPAKTKPKAALALQVPKITSAFSVSKAGIKAVTNSKAELDKPSVVADSDKNELAKPPSSKAVAPKPLRRVSSVGKIEKTGTRARNIRSRKSEMSLTLPGTSEFCLSSLPETTAPTPLPTSSFRCSMDPSTQLTWTNPISQKDGPLIGTEQEHSILHSEPSKVTA